jgi:hypothetical protein
MMDNKTYQELLTKCTKLKKETQNLDNLSSRINALIPVITVLGVFIAPFSQSKSMRTEYRNAREYISSRPSLPFQLADKFVDSAGLSKFLDDNPLVRDSIPDLEEKAGELNGTVRRCTN